MKFYTILHFTKIPIIHRIPSIRHRMEKGNAYLGTTTPKILNYLSTRTPKTTDIRDSTICHFANTHDFNDLTPGTRGILQEAQEHHNAGSNSPGEGDKQFILDIIKPCTHHLVAFIPSLSAIPGNLGEKNGKDTDQLLSQEELKGQTSPAPSPIQPARAHSTSPALHGRSPLVGVELTDWVAAPATSECMPESVSEGALDRR